jgi:hypothetical protein
MVSKITGHSNLLLSQLPILEGQAEEVRASCPSRDKRLDCRKVVADRLSAAVTFIEKEAEFVQLSADAIHLLCADISQPDGEPESERKAACMLAVTQVTKQRDILLGQSKQVAEIAFTASMKLELERKAAQSEQAQVTPNPSQPLPISSTDLLSVYQPAAQLISQRNTVEGTTIRSYRGKYHVLGLVEANGRLVRAVMRFDDRSAILRSADGSLVVPVWMALFISKTTCISYDEVPAQMRRLGLNEAWSPTEHEAVINGVKVRKYIQDGSLFLEATPD